LTLGVRIVQCAPRTSALAPLPVLPMAPHSVPTLTAHGAEIPAIGFGTSSLGDCGEVVATALKLGYRHIDTAWKYGTERGVGEGIRASGVGRDELFLTTKVSHEYLRTDDFARSVDESLENLGVDFVELVSFALVFVTKFLRLHLSLSISLDILFADTMSIKFVAGDAQMRLGIA